MKEGNCGEGCGGDDRGYLQVPRSASLHQTLIEWDQLTRNKGSVGGGRQKNKSERANSTGQEGGTWKTHRSRHSRRCAVARTKKSRRPNCPKRSPGSQFVGEGERREKIVSQRCQSHEEGVKQEDLFKSALTSRPPALQHPRFPNPLQAKKNLEAERKQKCDFFRVWSGNFEIEKNEHTSGWRIFANHVPHILFFPKHLLPWDKTFSFIWKTSLGAKFVLGTMAGATVLYTQYPARVTT